jgi:transposase
MIIPFINVPFSSIHLYQKPVSMRFGEKKLLEVCRSALKREPRVNELFLFYNGKRDTLKLLWLDGAGSQELSKSMPRGGFLLPAPRAGETFVRLERTKLSSLFRS